MKKYKVYTKGGDKGRTSLIGGKRVAKTHPRVEAYGTIDELNSYLGYLRSLIETENIKTDILDIQHQLMRISSHVAAVDEAMLEKFPGVETEVIRFLEQKIDGMEESLPSLLSFILPGGDVAASVCHIARTVCRRAERRVLEIEGMSADNPLVIAYLNRLSDYLFVLARLLAKINGAKESVFQG